MHRITVFLLGIVWAVIVQAGPIARYQVQFQVDQVTEGQGCAQQTDGRRYFGCIAVGDVFTGSFGVDSEILSVDGTNNTAEIFDFYLPFGIARYSTDPSLNLALFGFRNPDLGAAAPGFLVEGGEVVDFVGGLYGRSDSPFINLNGYIAARNRFVAFDDISRAFGDVTISRIPEPSSGLLLMLALASLAMSRRVRSRRSAGTGTR